MWQNTYQKMYGETLDFQYASATVARNNLRSNLLQKPMFPIGYLMLPLVMLTSKV